MNNNKIAKTLLDAVKRAEIVGFHPCNGGHWFGGAFEFDDTTEADPYRKGVIIIVPCDVLRFRTDFLDGKVQMAPLPDVEETPSKTWLQDMLTKLRRPFIKP